ncbi:MAG: MATE family efflux transporter [Spirochaetales bacterium]|nr:MATE family efflux transporter [Spirochaetales bacterium]
MLEQLLNVTIGMADILMVTTVGEAAVSAISLVDSITILIVTLFGAFATGGAVVSSQYLGKKDDESANVAARQLLNLTVLIATLLLPLCIPVRRRIIGTIFGKIEPLILDYGSTYFLYILLSLPFLAAYNSAAALFRSMGNSRVSLSVSVVVNILNIGGNALFIFVMKMGVAGAGLSTLVSRVIGSILVLGLLRNPGNRIAIRSYNIFHLKGWMIRKILFVGIPTGVEGSLFQIGKLLVQGFIASFGTAQLAANAIAASVSSFINIPGGAISMASVTIIGQTIGARRIDLSVHYAKRLLLFAYIAMFILATPIFLLAPTIASFFNLSEEATGIATVLFRSSMVASIIFWPSSFVLPNFLRAAGDAKFTMIVSIIGMWAFRVGGSYIMAMNFGWGVYGVWIGMYIDWIVRSIAFIRRFARGRWKEIQVI